MWERLKTWLQPGSSHRTSRSTGTLITVNGLKRRLLVGGRGRSARRL